MLEIILLTYSNRYVSDVRECLRNRIQCGMLQDEALLIQENCYMELTQINEIREKHKVFQEYIYSLYYICLLL